MGFMDKVKEAGTSLATSVNDTVSKGQQQVDQGQSKKQADALLRDLGALVYARDTERDHASTEAEVARVTGALQAHEAQGGAIDLAVRVGVAPAPPPGSPDAPPSPGGASVPPPPGSSTPPAPGAVAPPPPPGAVGGA